MKAFILTATSDLAGRRAGVGWTSSYAFPFKMHCSVLPARRPTSLPAAILSRVGEPFWRSVPKLSTNFEKNKKFFHVPMGIFKNKIKS